MKIKYYLLALICLVSCVQEDDIRIYRIGTFDHRCTLEGERMPFDEIDLTSPGIYDSLIVFRAPYDPLYAYRVYSLNTWRHLGNLFPKGRGPGEMVLPQILPQPVRHQNGDLTIWVLDFPRSVSLCNLTESIGSGRTIVDTVYEFARPGKNNILYESNTVYVLGEALFRLWHSDRGRSEERAYTGHRYRIYDFRKDSVLKEISFRYNFNIVEQPNREMTKIVGVSSFEDMISVYDLLQEREYLFCHSFKRPEEAFNILRPSGGARIPDSTYVRAMFLPDDRLIALYNSSAAGESTAEGGSVLHLFNLEGRGLFRIALKERLSTLAHDRRSFVLYGQTPEGAVYRYDLMKLPNFNKSY